MLFQSSSFRAMLGVSAAENAKKNPMASRCAEIIFMMRRCRNCNLTLVKSLLIVGSILFIIPPAARSQEPVHLALPSKAFQYVIFPIARDRGYMREEGIDLRIVLMQITPSIQGVMAGHVQFTGSGSSALVAIAKSGAPLKTVLAINNKVHQWILAKPAIGSLKELKGKKIATTGLASAATFMVRQILAKQGIDPAKDVVFVTAPAGNRLTILTSGVVDASIVGSEDRYPGLDQGMKELVNIGGDFGPLYQRATQTHDRLHACDPQGDSVRAQRSRSHGQCRGEVYRHAAQLGRPDVRRSDRHIHGQRRGGRGYPEKRHGYRCSSGRRQRGYRAGACL
jgi:hypothetical protein